MINYNFLISHYIPLYYHELSSWYTNPNIVVASFHVNIALFHTWLTHSPTFTRIFLELPQGVFRICPQICIRYDIGPPWPTYAKKSSNPTGFQEMPKKTSRHLYIYIYRYTYYIIYIYRANLQESFQHSGVETIYNNWFVVQSSKQSSQHIWSLENLQRVVSWNGPKDATASPQPRQPKTPSSRVSPTPKSVSNGCRRAGLCGAMQVSHQKWELNMIEPIKQIHWINKILYNMSYLYSMYDRFSLV